MVVDLGKSVHSSLGKNIFEELGLEKLPTEQKRQLLTSFLQAVQSAITNRVVERLSPEQAKEFDRLNNTNNQEALDNFFKRSVPDLDQIVIEEVTRFKQSVAKDVAEISKRVNSKLEAQKTLNE